MQGEPRAQFYCHCAEVGVQPSFLCYPDMLISVNSAVQCARTHATHFVEVIAFQDGANAFKITSGEEMLQSYGTEK